MIDQADVIRYDADGNRIEEYAFPVAYRDKEGEHPLIKSAQELFDKMPLIRREHLSLRRIWTLRGFLRTRLRSQAHLPGSWMETAFGYGTCRLHYSAR